MPSVLALRAPPMTYLTATTDGLASDVAAHGYRVWFEAETA